MMKPLKNIGLLLLVGVTLFSRPLSAFAEMGDGGIFPIISPETQDANQDGHIDRIVFASSYDLSLATKEDFLVTDCDGRDSSYVINGFTGAVGEGTLYLTPSMSLDTAVTCSVTYVPSTYSVTTTDGAGPAVKSAAYADADADGTIDRVTIRFSETLDAENGSCEGGDWNLTLGDFTSFGLDCNTFSLSGDTVLIGVTMEGEDIGRTSSVESSTIGFNHGGGSPTIMDVFGNPAASNLNMVPIEDNAAPVLLTAVPAHGSSVSDLTEDITLTFSEPMDTSFTAVDSNALALFPICNTDSEVAVLVLQTPVIATWDEQNEVLTLSHDPLVNDTCYTLSLDGAQSAAEEDGPLPSTVLEFTTAAVPGIVVSEISGNTKEEGTSATFTVRLSTPPTLTDETGDLVASVTVALTNTDTSEGALNVSTLTFTADNWNIPQTVTVTGVDDSIDDGDVTYAMNLAVTDTTDTEYTSVTASVSVTNEDNDTTQQSSGGGGGGGGGGGSYHSIDLTNPDGGETYAAGTRATITWSSVGSGMPTVNIYFSKDGGVTYTLVAGSETNDGAYTWTIPSDAATNAAKVKIQAMSGDIIRSTDTGAVFTITPSGNVLGTTDENTNVDGVTTGAYIRSPSWSTVYYVDAGNIRRPFIDEQTFFTYADSWNDVLWVTDEELSLFTLGKPMLPKAGVVLVKIMSANDVYALEVQGVNTVLRKIPNEVTATYLFGARWADYVIDVEPTHFKRFTMGTELDTSYHVDMAKMKTRAYVNSR